jgi:hypothetical protein
MSVDQSSQHLVNNNRAQYTINKAHKQTKKGPHKRKLN